MLFQIPIDPLPKIFQAYELDRKTVWRCADRRNILVFITDGTCQFEIDGETISAEQGDAILLPSGQEYTRRPIGEKTCRLFYVHFITGTPIRSVPEEEAEQSIRDTLAESALLTADERLSQIPRSLFLARRTTTGDAFSKLSEILHRIPTRRRSAPHLAPLFVSLIFTEFLAALSQETVTNIRGNTQSGRLPLPLRQALTYVQQNYDKKISTEDLCAHCNLSPQHLIRLFKKHMGMTPLQYINKSKTMHAIELLRTSELSVKEIAYALGFDNPNYFSRLFSKEQHSSPSEVRERIRTYRGGEGALRDEKDGQK